MHNPSRTLLLALATLGVALAGCLDENGGPGTAEAGQPEETSTTDDPSDPTTGSEAEDNATAEPPEAVASIEGDGVNGTDADGRTLVTPGVPVILDGSASQDPEEGNLSYDWSVGNNTFSGRILNATFDTPGNLTIVLVVTSDASGLSGNTSLEIHVVDPDAGAPPPRTETITGSVSGTWVPVVEEYHPSGCNEHDVVVDAVYAVISLSIDFGTTAVDLDYGFFAPDSTRADYTAQYNEPTGMVPVVFAGAGERDLMVEDPELLAQTGTWTVEVCPGVSAAGEYEVTVNLGS